MTRGELLKWAVRQSRAGLIASWAGGLGYQAGLIALPWCLGRAVDEGITGGDHTALLIWAGATLAVSVALTGAEWAMRWWSTLAAVRTGNALLLRLAGRVLGWDAATANRFNSGDLVMRGTRDTEQVTIWLSTVPSLASGVLGLITVLVVVAGLDPLLALIGLATIPLLIAVNLWYPRRYERASEALSAAHGARADAVEDLLSASTAVRGLGGEAVLVERHHVASANVRDHTLALARVAAAWSAHAPFVPWLATAVGVAVGGLAVLDGRFSIGGLVAFASWMALLGRQVMMLTLRFSQFGDAWTAAGRIGEVLGAAGDEEARAEKPGEARAEKPSVAGAETAGESLGPLRTASVTVTLPGRGPLSIPDISVKLGEFVAITGPVGSGKSTLLRLLARLTEPDEGAVMLGDVDVRDVDLEHLRDTITLVGQRPLLLSGTIADNLRLGRDIDDDRLRDACRRAAILDHVESLPDGFGAELGERGSGVSGGQAQRLALARGLLRGSRVLLLDDVTSAVDAGTEQRILDGLRGLGVTIVFATSRPAVAERADRVIELGVNRELVHG
ncbi:ABC transporter ATP-binding protein [Actinoplanes subglobosus]|uniref:ABC transporter ATP-binding protein n=1 Tax=Actinoplanes subglobosus TaxID=1547892 RepID=A0ABV8IM65_9ACTN